MSEFSKYDYNTTGVKLKTSTGMYVSSAIYDNIVQFSENPNDAFIYNLSSGESFHKLYGFNYELVFTGGK